MLLATRHRSRLSRLREHPWALAACASVVALAACSASPEPNSSTTSSSSSTTSTGGGASSSSSTGAVGGGGTGGTGGTGGQGGTGGMPCPADDITCDGTVKKVCDGIGGFSEVVDCAPGICIPFFGCATCVPGSGTCVGDVSHVCDGAGAGYIDSTCDPVQGVTCNATTGLCEGACAPQVLGQSYVGCDYYPTVTANSVLSNVFHFAVAVANTTATPANVKVTQALATVATVVVAPNDVAIIDLPWVELLKNSGSAEPTASLVVASGAYRLRSDQPVSVYQYSPIEYTDGIDFSYQNDASLLLPVNAWTGNYRVVSRNAWAFEQTNPKVWFPGFYAVTASENATVVTILPSPTGGSVKPGGGVAADGTGSVLLNQGDVLEVFTDHGAANPDPSDVTGTLIAADKPVQVIGGHKCTFVPWDVGYCDHLEESIPPLETLAKEYIVTAPLIPTGGTVPKAEMVRIVATADNTTLTYDPPQPGAPASIAVAGGYVEIGPTLADFKVTASANILVSQYMQGQNAGGGSGDPAMALAVATAQYRDNYLFHAPTNYEKNFVNVTAKTGDVITLDGAPVAGFTPIGATGYSIARVELSNAGTGNHTISSPGKFGISVYGYGQYTSYWYPGGLDLVHF